MGHVHACYLPFFYSKEIVVTAAGLDSIGQATPNYIICFSFWMKLQCCLSRHEKDKQHQAAICGVGPKMRPNMSSIYNMNLS